MRASSTAPAVVQHSLAAMAVAGNARAVPGRIAMVIAQVISDLDIQGPLQDRLGDLGQQTVGAVDRGTGGSASANSASTAAGDSNCANFSAAPSRDESDRDKAEHSCPVVTRTTIQAQPLQSMRHAPADASGGAQERQLVHPGACHSPC